MKPVAWRYENKNVKGNWYITWTEPPDGFNKRPLYEHPPQDAANSCLFQMQEAAKDLERQLSIRDAEIDELRQRLAEAQAGINEQARIVGMGGEREIDLRQNLGIVSALLSEASGRMSHGHWSSEFRARVETALKTKAQK